MESEEPPQAKGPSCTEALEQDELGTQVELKENKCSGSTENGEGSSRSDGEGSDHGDLAGSGSNNSVS